MRYFVELAYRGDNYFGWQRQPKHISVQQVLEEKLSTLLREEIAVVGAGRTDTGVHARKIYAHFDYSQKLDLEKLQTKLNSFLPRDISIFKILEVADEAHARFDAKHRAYEYLISRTKDPFRVESHYEFKYKLDIDMMNKACDILYQYSDFKCFSKSKTDVNTYLCNIMEAKWTLSGSELKFYIRADRFLRNMVRAIVGSMLDIGEGKMNLEQFKSMIESRDRSKAGVSVPGNALYLVDVEYDFIK